MDYEKKYKEALERAKQKIDAGFLTEDDLSYIFPELRESEDEGIRKAIVHLLEVASEAYLIEATGFKKEQFLSYLEKQKEQKPEEAIKDRRQIAFMIEDGRRCGVIEGRKQVIDNPEMYGLQKLAEWSEEDKRRIDAICELLENTSAIHPNYSHRKLIIWLKSLRPQPKQEWSKEDENKIERLAFLASVAAEKEMISEEECIDLRNFIKSIRPQPHEEKKLM